jgi:hypothetical protein
LADKKRKLMSFFTTVSVFLFFVVGFLLMWCYMYISSGKDWRSTFVSSALYEGLFIWALTELLSLFNVLEFSSLLCGWLGHDVCLALLIAYSQKKERLHIPKLSLFPLRWEYGVLAFILLITFFIAIVYPPNNWDSLTYHAPRVEHWLQNESIKHFYTHDRKQISAAPFAEMVVLHGRALSGGDWLENLVQWFAFAGTIIVISKIACLLGLTKKHQMATSLLFATLPMAIMQATSTQTDLVETFWIICLTERFLIWKKEKTLHQSIDFGIALGLAILTKGTAYPIAFPLVLYFAVISLKHPHKCLQGAFIAAFLCLFINLPHYIRNYIALKEPIGVIHGTMSDFSVKSFLITFVLDILTNIPIRFPEAIRPAFDDFLSAIWTFFDADISFFPHGIPNAIDLGGLMFFDDRAKNVFHIPLIILAFFILLVRKRNTDGYIWIALGAWCMFALCISWQPWITRLQTPLFALSVPLIVIAFEKNRFRNTALIFLCCYAFFPLFFNQTRPLIPIEPLTYKETFYNTSRKDLVYHSGKNYNKACEIIEKTGKEQLGLLLGVNTAEYPIWRYFKQKSGRKLTISHQNPDSLAQNVDLLFIFDKNDFLLKQQIIAFDETPHIWVLQRNKQESSQWEVLFKGSLE